MDNKFRLILKELNIKATPKRVAILETLAGKPLYMSPDEVWRHIKERFKRVGLPTIYRNLEELSEYGIISKVIHPNRRLYYYFCQKNEHHHHFICISCRKVREIELCNISEIEKDIEKTLNGKVLDHILQLNGLCVECLNSKNDSLLDKRLKWWSQELV